MRAVLTLLVKELQHHGPALAAAGVLALTTLSLFWSAALQRALPTLMMAASGFVYYLVPLYVVFVVNRLVVQDRNQGTHAFLAALPLSPALRFAVTYGLGAVTVATLTAVAVLTTAVVAASREGLPASWLLQLLGQCQLYALAWFAMDFGIAHLGRYRILTWWLLLGIAITLDGDVLNAWHDLMWHGVLDEPIDQTRARPPLANVPVTLAWIAAGTGLGVGLATWRGGVVSERAFERGTSRGAGVQFLLGLMLPLVLEVVVDLATFRSDDAWSTLSRTPVAGVDLRVAGAEGSDLWKVGEDAATDLAKLADRAQVGPFPTVVLVGGVAEDFEEVRVAPGSANDRSLVLVVDVRHDHGDLVRQVVYATLMHHTGWLMGWRTETDWLLRGTPGWLRPDPVLVARAAGGAAAKPFVPDWLRMELEVGEDVAEGVAWAMVDDLDDSQVITLLHHLLSRSIDRPSLLASLRISQRVDPDWVQRLVGVDLGSRWSAVLAHRATQPPVSDHGLTLSPRGEGLVAEWEGPLPPGAKLRWRKLDSMTAHPSPGEDSDLVSLDPGATKALVPIDPDECAAAELVWPDPSIRGIRTTGYGARW